MERDREEDEPGLFDFIIDQLNGPQLAMKLTYPGVDKKKEIVVTGSKVMETWNPKALGLAERWDEEAEFARVQKSLEQEAALKELGFSIDDIGELKGASEVSEIQKVLQRRGYQMELPESEEEELRQLLQTKRNIMAKEGTTGRPLTTTATTTTTSTTTTEKLTTSQNDSDEISNNTEELSKESTEVMTATEVAILEDVEGTHQNETQDLRSLMKIFKGVAGPNKTKEDTEEEHWTTAILNLTIKDLIVLGLGGALTMLCTLSVCCICYCQTRNQREATEEFPMTKRIAEERPLYDRVSYSPLGRNRTIRRHLIRQPDGTWTRHTTIEEVEMQDRICPAIEELPPPPAEFE